MVLKDVAILGKLREDVPSRRRRKPENGHPRTCLVRRTRTEKKRDLVIAFKSSQSWFLPRLIHDFFPDSTSPSVWSCTEAELWRCGNRRAVKTRCPEFARGGRLLLLGKESGLWRTTGLLSGGRRGVAVSRSRRRGQKSLRVSLVWSMRLLLLVLAQGSIEFSWREHPASCSRGIATSRS